MTKQSSNSPQTQTGEERWERRTTDSPVQGRKLEQKWLALCKDQGRGVACFQELEKDLVASAIALLKEDFSGTGLERWLQRA